MSYRHNFLHISFTENDKNLIFRYVIVNVTFYPPKIKWEMMFILTYFNTGLCFYLYPQKKKKKKIENFQNFIYNIWQIVRVWHLNIHKDWSRSVFRKYGKFQNVLTSLFLIRFSSFLCHFVGKFFLFLAHLSRRHCRPFSSVVRKLFTFSSSSWKRMVGF